MKFLCDQKISSETIDVCLKVGNILTQHASLCFEYTTCDMLLNCYSTLVAYDIPDDSTEDVNNDDIVVIDDVVEIDENENESKNTTLYVKNLKFYVLFMIRMMIHF